MDKRQGWRAFALLFIFFVTGCAAKATEIPPTPQPSPTPTPTRLPSTPTVAAPTSTPDPCLGARGQVEEVAFDSTSIPSFYIYFPACYPYEAETHYPVLYLMHGQNYQADQWLRLGVAEQADALMTAGEIPPFLIVMPFNKASWRGADVDEFGDVLVDELIPYIDETYRTLGTREYRALGGLSRGGGWAIRYGLTRPDLFGAFGAHSPAIFYRDYGKLDNWLEEMPAEFAPQVYLDIGDQDGQLADALYFADLLAESAVLHEFHLYTGSHEERYWKAHLEEYLRWYGRAFE